MFFKKKASGPKADFSLLQADMHSHLIPGIDDGSDDLGTSLELVQGMSELGYKKLITTPHIMWDMYPNKRENILKGLDELNTAVQKARIDVEIRAAAEYFIDDHFIELLKKREPLLPIGGMMVLVEFSMASPPLDLKTALFEMQLQGYQPVIAHPERYIYLESAKEFYSELRDHDCLFQLNILSMSGFYGRSAMELAQYLAKKEYYDFVGTDLHNFKYLDALHNPALNAPLKRLLETGKIRNGEL